MSNSSKPTIKKTDHTCTGVMRRVAAWLNGLACVALACLMLLVTANVIFRVVFKSPILGTYDMSGFLTVILIGGGLAFCALHDGHIEIGFFIAKMAPKVQRVIVLTGRLLSFLTLAAGTYAFFNLAARQIRTGEVSVTTRTPLYWFTLFTGICFTLLALAVLAKLVDSLRKEPSRDI